MITIDQAKALRVGDILYHVTYINHDKTPQRWRVSGKVKTWKRDVGRVQVPIKHGLYTCDYLTENNLHLMRLQECDV